jgi:hypothetical protein
MSQISKKGFDTGDSKKNSTEDGIISCAGKKADCFGGIICAENPWVVLCDVDCPCDEEGCEPETDDGCEEKGNPFCPELLDEKLD